MAEAKPFDVPKRLVWEAYKRVKANRGAAGVGVTRASLSTGSLECVLRPGPYGHASIAKDTLALAAGDRVGTWVTTSAGFAPTTAHLVAVLYAEIGGPAGPERLRLSVPATAGESRTAAFPQGFNFKEGIYAGVTAVGAATIVYS